jgi:GT2 family glycosyltransferase
MNRHGISLQVVIPTTGRSPDLNDLVLDLRREALRSPSVSLRITIVDDGSGTEFNFPREDQALPIEIVWNPQSQGAAAARNLGAARSDSDWIAFIDDDVRLPLGWLDSLGTLLTSSKADMIGGEVKSLEERNWFSQASEDFIVRHKEYPEGWYLVSAHLFCRRQAFEVLNGFRADLFNRGCGSEDWDLSRRAHSAGLSIEISNAVQCRHRNPTNAKDFMYRARSYGATSRLLDEPGSESLTDSSRTSDADPPPDSSKVSYLHLIHRAGTWPLREYRTLRGLGRSRTRAFRNTLLYVPWMAQYLRSRQKTV